jgi:hypothetical protein
VDALKSSSPGGWAHNDTGRESYQIAIMVSAVFSSLDFGMKNKIM